MFLTSKQQTKQKHSTPRQDSITREDFSGTFLSSESYWFFPSFGAKKKPAKSRLNKQIIDQHELCETTAATIQI